MIVQIVILLFVMVIILGLPQKNENVSFATTEHFGPTLTDSDIVPVGPNTNYNSISEHPDFDKYILKSSLKSCNCDRSTPCMVDYMLKTECVVNGTPDIFESLSSELNASGSTDVISGSTDVISGSTDVISGSVENFANNMNNNFKNHMQSIEHFNKGTMSFALG